MEHNKHPSEKIEFLQRACNDFAKEEERNKHEEKQDEFVKEEERYQCPPFDDSKAPKPFRVKMITRNVHYSSDSDSSGSEYDSDTEEDSGQAKISGEYQYPSFKPFRVKMITRNVHYSSDSYSSNSDSESDYDTEEESKLKEDSPNTAKELEFQPDATPEEDKTPPTPRDPKEVVDFDPKSQTNKTVLVHLMSGPNIPDSSILEEEQNKHEEKQDEFVKEEERYQYPPFDNSKAPKPFRVKMITRNVHYSSDSDSSGSESDSDTEEDSGQDSGQAKISGEYQYPSFKPFRVKIIPRNVHYSSDSYSSNSDSESDYDTEEESKLKEDSPNTAKELEFQHDATPEEDKTPPTPRDPKEVVDFDPKSQTNKTVLVDLMSGPNIPDSSILVKHGTKHTAEASDKDGDKDSKRAKTSQE